MDSTAKRRLGLRVLASLNDPDKLQRSCGECTACCEVIGVEELGKPYYAKCEFQGDKCCNRYETRPPSCREYACHWKLGLVGDDESTRPDNCGFLVTLEWDHDRKESFIEIYHARPEDASEETIRILNRLIRQAATNTPDAKGVKLYRYGCKVSVGYEISAPYPKGTTNIGNYYIPHEDGTDVYWHIPPETAKALMDERKPFIPVASNTPSSGRLESELPRHVTRNPHKKGGPNRGWQQPKARNTKGRSR